MDKKHGNNVRGFPECGGDVLSWGLHIKNITLLSASLDKLPSGNQIPRGITGRCCLPFTGHHEVDIQKPRVEAPRRREGCYLSYC